MMTTGSYPDSSEPVARVRGRKPARAPGGSPLFPSAYPRRGWSGGQFQNEPKPLRPHGGKTTKRG